MLNDVLGTKTHHLDVFVYSLLLKGPQFANLTSSEHINLRISIDLSVTAYCLFYSPHIPVSTREIIRDNSLLLEDRRERHIHDILYFYDSKE